MVEGEYGRRKALNRLIHMGERIIRPLESLEG